MSESMIAEQQESYLAPLKRAIDVVLEPLIPEGSHCALLDYPNYSNVGDSAIWLGETSWIRKRAVHVSYQCDHATYSAERLAGSLGEGIILLSGGGNFGDFWYSHQAFREQVVRDFPNNKIIQLPQTIHFLDDWSVEEARRTINEHKDFTLLCRDRQSLNFVHALISRARV